MTKTISIIGLGKLGSCMAAVYASKGYHVIGVDLNPVTVATVNDGRAPVSETGLQALFTQNRERIEATTDTLKAVNRSDITFIIVPTPSVEDGSFSTQFVTAACQQIGLGLATKQGGHLVVLTSTLLPGDCERDVIPMLEQASGKKVGKDFDFCYSPLFIAIGSVIKNLLHPDFFLVGEFDKPSGDILESFYETTCDNRAPIRRMSIPSAELTKISVNSYVTMKITFANMLGEVAEHIPGADIDDVTDALGNDKRIGSAYLKSGLGYGGPCFPRDNRAFAAVAARRGVHVPFASKTDEYNQSVMDRWTANIQRTISPLEPVAIVGTSYKPGTAFAEESQAIGIAKRLLALGYHLHIFNPYGNEHAQELLGDSVTYHDSLGSCLGSAHVLFLGLPMESLARELKQRDAQKSLTIIDPWKQL